MRFKILFLLLLPVIFGSCMTYESIEETQNIYLEWQATDTLDDKEYLLLKTLRNSRITLLPIQDVRDEKTAIGVNLEEEYPRYYKTPDDVSSWSTESIIPLLKYYNINLVDTSPDILLQFELIKFYVTEESTYKGNVTIKLSVQNPDGEILWEDIKTGRSNRWGRSLSEENFLECLGNSFLESVYSLLADKEFHSIVNETQQ